MQCSTVLQAMDSVNAQSCHLSHPPHSLPCCRLPVHKRQVSPTLVLLERSSTRSSLPLQTSASCVGHQEVGERRVGVVCVCVWMSVLVHVRTCVWESRAWVDVHACVYGYHHVYAHVCTVHTRPELLCACTVSYCTMKLL